MTDQIIEFSVSEFVAVLNQTLEYAYGTVTIYGELVNFRISKGRWVYFSLKDDDSKIDFFGSVYALPGPLEDGMLLKVKGTPRLHHQFGFSVNFMAIQPTGSGSIKRINDLLIKKLETEGLFSPERKRALVYPPKSIGLITSSESAAVTDFIKVVNDRWVGMDIDCFNVSVQGYQAPDEIIKAVEYFSALAEPPDVVVIIRGGGSNEDLASFNDERVVRAIAASRVPTLVAIGHERDVSLAELVADRRASTPSNAAEVLVPDKKSAQAQLADTREMLGQLLIRKVELANMRLASDKQTMISLANAKITNEQQKLDNQCRLLAVLNPKAILSRGYAIVRLNNQVVSSDKLLKEGMKVNIEMMNLGFESNITKVWKGIR